MVKPNLIFVAGCNASGKSTFIRTRLKNNLLTCRANNLQYPQRFAQFAFSKNRLNEEAYNIITANQDFPSSTFNIQPSTLKK